MAGGDGFKDVEREVVSCVVDGEDHEEYAKNLGDGFKKFFEFILFNHVNREAHGS